MSIRSIAPVSRPLGDKVASTYVKVAKTLDIIRANRKVLESMVYLQQAWDKISGLVCGPTLGTASPEVAECLATSDRQIAASKGENPHRHG